MKKLCILSLVLISLLAGCKNSKTKKLVTKDTTITQSNSFNGLFLDSTQLESFLNQNDSLEKYRSYFFDFYTQRNFELAWFDKDGLNEQAENFYNLQNNFAESLDDSSIYNPKLKQLYELLDGRKIEGKKDKKLDTAALNTELMLTGQFFEYASKVYKGSDIDAADLGWFIPRKKINTTALLDSLVTNQNQPLSAYEPLNSQYRKLESWLANYYLLKKHNAWETIPADTKVYQKGDSGMAISLIKKRLMALGDLPTNNNNNIFDSSTTKAVQHFQDRFGITPNGIIKTATLEALNTPLDTLINKILINMERARWMLPDTSKEDRLVVNIPDYKLSVFDSGKFSFSMPVVVGTAGNSTVIFNGRVRYIVFSPYWNVTDDIVKKEIMPAMARDKNYLAKNNMEIVRYEGAIPEVRQKPGGNNSLGGVKFLFPNKYNIYLHDTPHKEAFASSKRSFSHGCIRVGDPAKLAQFLLRRDTHYTADSIKTLMNQTQEKWVTAKPTVQVIIKYFTAWVDHNGVLNFRDDIYGHDNTMAQKLFDK